MREEDTGKRFEDMTPETAELTDLPTRTWQKYDAAQMDELNALGEITSAAKK